MAQENLVGQQFGRWTVLELCPERSADGRIQYLCECNCEARTRRLVIAKSLKSGASKSCGCLRRERSSEVNKGNAHGRANAKDLAGQTFGHLTAIKRLATKSQGCWDWHCVCDCGNEVIANTRDLTGSRKTRCNDCSSKTTISKGEEAIAKLLQEHKISFEQQKTFETCRFNDTNQLAKFDFFIPLQNYLIEFDGEQHFGVSDSSAWKEKVSRIPQRDAYKNQWCKDNNILLIRIPYTRLKNLCIEDLQPNTSCYIVNMG